MKVVLKSAIALGALALASSGAMAQSASGTVNVTATIAASCTISLTSGGTAISAGALLGTYDFSPTSGSTISTTPTMATVTPTAYGDCNTPTHLTLQSANGKAILPSGSTVVSGGGYGTSFNYKMTAAFGAATVSLDTAADTTTVKTSLTPTAAPLAAQINFSLVTSDGSKLAAATYSDVVTVALTAN